MDVNCEIVLTLNHHVVIENLRGISFFTLTLYNRAKYDP